jgi:hypothetical protein
MDRTALHKKINYYKSAVSIYRIQVILLRLLFWLELGLGAGSSWPADEFTVLVSADWPMKSRDTSFWRKIFGGNTEYG